MRTLEAAPGRHEEKLGGFIDNLCKVIRFIFILLTKEGTFTVHITVSPVPGKKSIDMCHNPQGC